MSEGQDFGSVLLRTGDVAEHVRVRVSIFDHRPDTLEMLIGREPDSWIHCGGDPASAEDVLKAYNASRDALARARLRIEHSVKPGLNIEDARKVARLVRRLIAGAEHEGLLIVGAAQLLKGYWPELDWEWTAREILPFERPVVHDGSREEPELMPKAETPIVNHAGIEWARDSEGRWLIRGNREASWHRLSGTATDRVPTEVLEIESEMFAAAQNAE